jgi:hypothetical protein
LSSLRILASFLLNKASGREPYPDLQLTAEAQVGLFGQLMLAPATAAPVAEPPDTSPPDSGGA